MKKLYSIIIAIILTVSLKINVTSVSAKELNYKSSYTIDYNSKTVISSYNEDEKLPIASMTKIMLLNLIFESEKQGKISFADEITISKNASSMGGSQVFLEANASYNIGELVKSIVVASANDSSVALAEHLYGSEENCVNEMNSLAKELNLSNTHFANCTGLPKPMHYSSAKDISTMFCKLVSYPKYFDYSTVWFEEFKHKNGSTEMANTNKLIKFYEGCDGGKTGFTNEAGFCLVATAKRGNVRLISVVIGANTSKDRFSVVSSNFNDGFNNYTNKCILDKNMPLLDKIYISNAKENLNEVFPKDNFYVFSKKGANDNIEVVYDFDVVKAPLNKGDVVGKATIFNNGVECGRVLIVLNNNVYKKSYGDYLEDIINKIA